MSEIDNLAEQFPDNTIPVNIRLFLQYLLDNNDGDFIAVETLEDAGDFLKSLIPADRLNEFIPFAAFSNWAFAIWNKGEEKDVEQMPIAYFNDEGTYGVIASNFKDFVTVFSYELTWSLLSHWRRYNRRPQLTVSPYDMYDETELKSITDSLQEKPAYAKLITLMQNEMQIDLSKSPVKIVEDAVKEYPNLEELFTQKA